MTRKDRADGVLMTKEILEKSKSTTVGTVEVKKKKNFDNENKKGYLSSFGR